MTEQSHKVEMADALRGDFDRLRARGVATTLPTPADPRPPAEPAPSRALAPTEVESGRTASTEAERPPDGRGWLRRTLRRR